jgi:hypothetical protein
LAFRFLRHGGLPYGGDATGLFRTHFSRGNGSLYDRTLELKATLQRALTADFISNIKIDVAVLQTD